VLEPQGETTVLDLLDNLLNKGVVVHGDVTLGLAGVDLIYLQLSALLGAADRILGGSPRPRAVPPGRVLRLRRP
jgi:hypothetical protein